ncbi:MAG: T9SS type A sorting domain-containing protein [Sphingobacteriaceae bacterium]|nr:T9SS type A sorting domain-containing protein [Sphingobacteriaceae bacterium]
MFLRSQDLQWAKSFGDGMFEQGYSIVVDGNGNVYTTGYFAGTVDFDPGPGSYTLTSSGGNDIFISKLDVSGNFLWAKSIGSSANDVGWSIANDLAGNVLVTGVFQFTVDFDPGPSTYTLSGPQNDIFILKLDALGNFIWAKNMGGANVDSGYSIELDGNGNIYTTGEFSGVADFDPSPSIYTLTSMGSVDAFISKLDPSGNFIWAKSFEGSGIEKGWDIKVDASGNVYSTGEFQNGADFDPGASTYTLSSGFSDVFISKLDAAGNFVWAKSLIGSGGRPYSIFLDANANVYTTGFFQGTTDFDPSAGTYTLSAVNGDIFISKLDIAGNFVFAKSMGGPGWDNGSSIVVDHLGNIFTTGTFEGSVDFDPNIGSFILNSVGFRDIFISKLDPSGNFIWATNIGGNNNSIGNSIVLDINSNLYTTGYFTGTSDFDPSSSLFNLTPVGSADVFILKLGCPFSVNATSYTICSGSTSTLSSSASNTYTWNPGSTTGSSLIVSPSVTTVYSVSSTNSVGCNSFNTLSINVSPCTNVSSNSSTDDSIILYPNPSSTILHLKLTEGKSINGFVIMDVLGRNVLEQKENTTQINIEGLPKGIYQLLITSEGKSYTSKFIKE